MNKENNNVQTVSTEVYEKNRSVRGCIATAWRWWCVNGSRLWRSAWCPVVLLALSVALHTLAHGGKDLSDDTPRLILSVVAAVVMLAAGTWALARVMNILNQEGRRPNLRRAAVATAACLVGTAVVTGIIYGIMALCGTETADMPWWLAHIVAAVVLTLLTLPLSAYNMAYMARANRPYLNGLGSGLWTALRHYGFLFMLTVLLGTMLLIVTAVVLLPLVILGMANDASVQGVVGGDPSGMPASMAWVGAIVAAIVTLILWYMWQLMTVALYYATGSVRWREARRRNMTTTDDTDQEQ